ncbi:BNR repeat-containing protein [Catalinimonas sp. 4WD22]|uniref:BNR repeat-containing protein n=1 Tax=Catalinimonas locisalis TaxID=3133978 RepID=UPI0031016F09
MPTYQKRITFLLCSLISALLLLSCNTPTTITETAPATRQIDSLFIDEVWSGHPVGFALLTKPPHQFVAYYDSNRVMTVAQRQLGEKVWEKKKLPETIGWDSHNYISMALDSKGHVHVSGNMHVDSLVYFQASKPYDAASLERKEQLIGNLESRATYPKFFSSAEGDLVFTYRDGGSGNGNQIYNRYNPETQAWSRLLDEPLVDGKGERNAYLHGPVPGPDGYYHLIWVWRETPDAETNHDISYARSKNLAHWEQSDGSPQPLPITLENCEIIDPVPVEQGMINGNTKIGFDQNDQLVVTYHKFGPEGNTQVFNARREDEGWKIYQATDWDFRWDFGGRGSLNSRVSVFPVVVEQGQLTQQYWIDTLGLQKFLLDEENLSTVKALPVDKGYPEDLEKVRSTFPGMRVNLETEQTDEGDIYTLRWETLTRNRDLPREGDLPDASPLMLYHVSQDENQTF